MQKYNVKRENNLRNIVINISYLGTNYHGWQVQKNAITVQEVFQKVLYEIIKENVDIKGCSRTDTGVHANMYVINFKTNSKMSCDSFIYALNRNLPGDIAVNSCHEESLNFHARYSCKAKEYVYKIWNHKIRNPFLHGRTLHYWYPLDINLMNNACKYFIGKHDFTSFSTLDKRDRTNMVRTIEFFEASKNDNIVEFRVRADGFLYNMVRIMVGTLLRISQNKIKVDDIPMIIDKKDRNYSGPTVPPQGLYLDKVYY